MTPCASWQASETDYCACTDLVLPPEGFMCVYRPGNNGLLGLFTVWKREGHCVAARVDIC